MELAFGCEFASVRLHDDAEADFLSRSVRARAFTFGQHVFFKAGALAPHRPEGQRLFAHELAHVVEQRSTGERRIQRQPDNKPTQMPARLRVPTTQAEYEEWQRTHRKGTLHVLGPWLGRELANYNPFWFWSKGFLYAGKMYGGYKGAYFELWLNNDTGDEYRVFRAPEKPKETPLPKPVPPPTEEIEVIDDLPTAEELDDLEAVETAIQNLQKQAGTNLPKLQKLRDLLVWRREKMRNPAERAALLATEDYKDFAQLLANEAKILDSLHDLESWTESSATTDQLIKAYMDVWSSDQLLQSDTE